MIKKLTKEQKDLLPIFIDKWTKIGLCTDPSNKNIAENAIELMYKYARLKPPKKIVWCGSPLSQGLTISIILNNSVGNSVRDSVRDSVGNSVRDSVGNSVGNSVWNSVRDSVWNSVGNSVRDSVSNSVWNSVGDSVGNSVSNSVWNSVWNSVRDSVRDSVSNSVWNSVGDSVGNSVGNSVYGNHDAHWLGFYDFFNYIGLKKQTEKLKGLWLLSQNAGWALPYKNICWISERHNILNRDNDGRLHNPIGPSIVYPDGWKIYAIHGVRVKSWIIEEPNKINCNNIDKEDNSEVKRVMIDKYGIQKYIIDSGAQEISKDSYGTLYRKDIKNDEPITMVKVKNATIETDGRTKEYFLRVPPDIKSPQEAIAWTFNVPKEQYLPLQET